MKYSERLELLYDSIMCDIEFCTDVREILEAIKSNFEDMIKFEKSRGN